jgi:hypothetical protein
MNPRPMLLSCKIGTQMIWVQFKFALFDTPQERARRALGARGDGEAFQELIYRTNHAENPRVFDFLA